MLDILTLTGDVTGLGHWVEDNRAHQIDEAEQSDTRNSQASNSSAAALSQFQLPTIFDKLILSEWYLNWASKRERERPLLEGTDCCDVSRSPAANIIYIWRRI